MGNSSGKLFQDPASLALTSCAGLSWGAHLYTPAPPGLRLMSTSAAPPAELSESLSSPLWVRGFPSVGGTQGGGRFNRLGKTLSVLSFLRVKAHTSYHGGNRRAFS